jgi:hypothetical protein
MKHCELCNKTSKMAGTRILLRGHYNPTNWTRKYPNLQRTITPEGKRVNACTGCIKTFTKTARMQVTKEKKAALVAKRAAAAAAAPKPKPKAEKKEKKEKKVEAK